MTTNDTRKRPRGRPPGCHEMKRAPTFTTDERGRPIARVPLAGLGGDALIDREDWDRLMAAGISTSWYIVSTGDGPTRFPVVRVGVRGKDVAVARLILGADPRLRLVYATDDRRDLRRSNVSLTEVNPRGEGDIRTGTVRPGRWTSIARSPQGELGKTDKPKGPTKAQQRAALRAAEDAAYRDYQTASSERVARWKAWIEEQVAAGRNRDQVTAEGMAQARAERWAYCQEHGLDPETGRPPRLEKVKEAHPMSTPVAPAALSPEVVAELPFR